MHFEWSNISTNGELESIENVQLDTSFMFTVAYLGHGEKILFC